MKRTIIVALSVSIAGLLAYAHADASLAQPHASATTGLKLEAESSYRERDKVKMVRSFSQDAFKRDRSTLPAKVDIAKDFPTVGNQGAQASCVAWALAYAVKTAHEHRELGWNMSDANHVFSPAYVYNLINGGADDGSTIDQAIAAMRANGTVPLSVMPYDDLDYVTQPTTQQKNLGANFAIGEYRRVAENNVNELKRHLASGEPVVMAIKLYPTFMGEAIAKTGGMYATTSGDAITNHAIVLVGYDNAKQAFRFMNSWGPAWGDHGYGWLAYDFLPQVSMRAYVVYDTPTPKSAKTYLAALKGASIESYDMALGDPEEFHKKSGIRDQGSGTRKPTAVALPSPPPVAQTVEPFYLVPEERGIKVGDAWIRLGDEMSKARRTMGKPIAENEISLMFDDDKGRTVFMAEPGSGRIGQILFLHGMTSKSAGQTNRGLAIGASQGDAHRIYGTPDLVLGTMDTYFYEAVTEDFGGLDWVKHVTMLIEYDDEKSVRSIKLLKTDKGAMTGSYYAKMDDGEKKESATGTAIAASKGDIAFSVPTGYEEPKKSEWKDIGYGYFTRSKDGRTTLTIKVFNITGRDAQEAEEAFAKKDLSGVPQMMTIGKPEKKSWGGMEWTAYTIASDFSGPSIRAYAVRGDRLFSIVTTAPDKEWYEGSEAKQFFDSIKIK